MNLHFVYVAKSDDWKEKLREEWQYIYRMAKFYQYWLRKNFQLYYKVNTDVLVVVQAKLMVLRFGMSDLMKHHRDKGEEDYHVYLAYFRPRITDCSVGFFTDNVGLMHWQNYNGSGDRNKFLATNNCATISHVLLHEVGRQKKYGKKYRDTIHEQWDRHVFGEDEFEFYNEHYKLVSGNGEFMFATMKIPKPEQ